MPKTFVINNRVIGVINDNRGQIGTVVGINNIGNKITYNVVYDNGRRATFTNRAIDVNNTPPPLHGPTVAPQAANEVDNDQGSMAPSNRSSSRSRTPSPSHVTSVSPNIE